MVVQVTFKTERGYPNTSSNKNDFNVKCKDANMEEGTKIRKNGSGRNLKILLLQGPLWIVTVSTALWGSIVGTEHEAMDFCSCGTAQ
eukprot:3733723-Amphidinium_carterae.1